MTQFASVYVTCKDEDEAKTIAKHLIAKKLAACANIFPIQSIYVWDGILQDDREAAMLLKTRKALVKDVTLEIESIHSYDVPCVVVYDIIDGSQDYLDWVGAETGGSGR